MAESKPKTKGSGRLSFPRRVYDVLIFTEENNQEHIISWENNGTAFKVHDLEAFSRDFLPKYFNTTKYASFTRTLCGHGFDCVRTGRQTGIYSHPKFKKGEPASLSLIRRVKTNRTSKAKSSKASSGAAMNSPPDGKYVIRDGNQMVVLPSLLDDPRRIPTDGDASGIVQLYRTIRSQMADRTTKILVRLPPTAQLISPFDSETDSVEVQSPKSMMLQPSPAKISGSFRVSANWQQNRNGSQKHGSTSDDTAPPMSPLPNTDEDGEREQAFGVDGDFQDEECDDDFEPLPLSPQHDVLDDSIAPVDRHDDTLLSSLEPRNIQEMKENPDDLNFWYNALPVFPLPKYQAFYDYSSPIALLGLFYYMDISSFGIIWAIFLIIGHTIQALLTDYGPDTRNLVLIPKINLLKHLFLDILWVQSLLSAMVLVPEYFGRSSVILALTFLSSNPPSLGTSLKTHYHMHCQKGVPLIHGDWWMADIVRWLFLGYAVSILGISLGHFSSIEGLKVIGVFLMNMTPLFACQSYRLLLSIPTTTVEQQHSDKKHN